MNYQKSIKSSTVQYLFQDLIKANEALTWLEESLEGSLPKDIRELCDKIALEIIYTDELPKSVGGFLRRFPDIGPKIVINNSKSEKFQQFSIAHEIGHFYLFHDSESCEIDEDRQEQQATLFALQLLSKIVPPGTGLDFLEENPDLHTYVLILGNGLISSVLRKLPYLAIPLALLFNVLYYRILPPNPNAGEPIKREQL